MIRSDRGKEAHRGKWYSSRKERFAAGISAHSGGARGRSPCVAGGRTANASERSVSCDRRPQRLGGLPGRAPAGAHAEPGPAGGGGGALRERALPGPHLHPVACVHPVGPAPVHHGALLSDAAVPRGGDPARHGVPPAAFHGPRLPVPGCREGVSHQHGPWFLPRIRRRPGRLRPFSFSSSRSFA